MDISRPVTPAVFNFAAIKFRKLLETLLGQSVAKTRNRKVQRLQERRKETISMKRLTSRDIKKVLLGVVATDGNINKNRFDFFIKSEQYANYIYDVLSNISGIKVTKYFKEAKRKSSYGGYRVFTTSSVYFRKLYEIFYTQNRKYLSKYICDRLTLESIAHMWMCDGTLEHNINRKTGRIQNIGLLCLLKYDKEELEYFVKCLEKFNLFATIIYKPSAHGFKYFVKLSGMELQKFISSIYPYILDDYKYKTILYYKTLTRVDTSLPNTEQFIKLYDTIEDIVRHSW